MTYIKPVDLPVSSPYGPRGDGFHYGIDYSDGMSGHPIHAVEQGTVVYKAYEDGGFGNTVTVQHPDGTKSGYGHMMAPAIVEQGQHVDQGQVLGYVGTTGASTGPHLHLWMGSGPNPPGVIDPTPLLSDQAPPTNVPNIDPTKESDMFLMGTTEGKFYLFTTDSGVEIDKGLAYVLAISGMTYVKDQHPLTVVGTCVLLAQAKKNAEFWMSKL